MSDKIIKQYIGERATVTWDSQLCIHVGECVRAEGKLFEMGRRPWCDPDTSTTEEILEVVQRCPSGALSVVFSESSSAEHSAEQNVITLVYDGPLKLQGTLEIEGAPETSPGLSSRATLCRCGLSQNKPFCDNSHTKSDFHDAGDITDSGTPLTDKNGALQVKVREDGPLLIKGNTLIVSADGRTRWEGQGTALCRCGLSNNKPFCDGSHRSAGWKAD